MVAERRNYSQGAVCWLLMVAASLVVKSQLLCVGAPAAVVAPELESTGSLSVALGA